MFIPVGDINPRERIPVVNYTFIGFNVAVFALTWFRPDQELIAIWNEWAMVPSRWTVTTLFTSMFLHGDPFHLIGNLLYLWIAGDNVEDRCGKIIYPIFYLGAGLAASALHLVTITPASINIPTLGASGAISGVLGAYVVLFPHARIRFFYWVFYVAGFVHVPAWIAIGIWFLMQLVMGVLLVDPNAPGGGVAYWAHIGGFVFGLGAMFLLRLLGLTRKPAVQTVDDWEYRD